MKNLALVAILVLILAIPASASEGDFSTYLPMISAHSNQPRYGFTYGCPPGISCRPDMLDLSNKVILHTLYPDRYLPLWDQGFEPWIVLVAKLRDDLSEPCPWQLNLPSVNPESVESVLKYIDSVPNPVILLGNEPNGTPAYCPIPSYSMMIPAEDYGRFVAEWLPYLDGARVSLAGMAQYRDGWDASAYLRAAFPDGVDVDFIDQHLYFAEYADRDLQAVSEWRDAYAPNASIIVSEFGCAACPSSTVQDAARQMLIIDDIMDKYNVAFRGWYAFWNSETVWSWSFLVRSDGSPNEPLYTTYMEISTDAPR